LEPPAVLVVGRTAGLSAELWPDGGQRHVQPPVAQLAAKGSRGEKRPPADRRGVPALDAAAATRVFSTSLVGN